MRLQDIRDPPRVRPQTLMIVFGLRFSRVDCALRSLKSLEDRGLTERDLGVDDWPGLRRPS